jgi:hypothetical protein
MQTMMEKDQAREDVPPSSSKRQSAAASCGEASWSVGVLIARESRLISFSCNVMSFGYSSSLQPARVVSSRPPGPFPPSGQFRPVGGWLATETTACGFRHVMDFHVSVLATWR